MLVLRIFTKNVHDGPIGYDRGSHGFRSKCEPEESRGHHVERFDLPALKLFCAPGALGEVGARGGSKKGVDALKRRRLVLGRVHFVEKQANRALGRRIERCSTTGD
jgi:hypothetical protein